MTNDKTKPHIIIYGNPVDGQSFTGPFKDYDEALQWSEIELAGEGDWWVVGLEPYSMGEGVYEVTLTIHVDADNEIDARYQAEVWVHDTKRPFDGATVVKVP